MTDLKITKNQKTPELAVVRQVIDRQRTLAAVIAGLRPVARCEISAEEALYNSSFIYGC